MSPRPDVILRVTESCEPGRRSEPGTPRSPPAAGDSPPHSVAGTRDASIPQVLEDEARVRGAFPTSDTRQPFPVQGDVEDTGWGTRACTGQVHSGRWPGWPWRGMEVSHCRSSVTAVAGS